jgi:rare lipoprotein A (peptidoglycan hydrolase)
MRIAFAKHTLSLALAAVLMGPLASLALPASAAQASTGGAAAASTSTASTTPATSPGGTQASGSESAGGSSPTTSVSSSRTLATWFGPGFYGHTTACGQKMSPTLVGVASRTLACGTLVRFGYRGHELTVPVLDRGPYGHIGAVWDLTAGAARALSVKETVHVSAEIVGSLPNTPTLGEAPEAAPLAEAGTTSSASTTGGAAAS